MDTTTLTDLSAVDTLAARLEPGDGSNYVYVVEVTWEYTPDFYVIETPLDTDDLEALKQVFSTVYPRDEGITAFELIFRF